MIQHFCDRCNKKIALRGNDYIASRVTFGRNPGHQDGWVVEWSIRKEYEGNPTDLCASCVSELVNAAVEEKTISSMV